MVRTLSLILFFISITSAQADFLGFGGSDGKSRIVTLVEKIKSLEMKVEPAFEEEFNRSIKALENGLEEEKLYCAGELADAQGKFLPKENKQLCMRELKKNYLSAMETVYELKKKYLDLIHARQQEKLAETHKRLKGDIEKNF